MKKRQEGIAFFLILLLMIVGAFVVAFVADRVQQQFKLGRIDREIKQASYLANNSITDIMRQFSQNYYENHYDTSTIMRSPAFYKNGFSEVYATVNKSEHTVYLEAKGKYGSDPDKPKHEKELSAVIKFISDMTTYGTYANGDFTTSASNFTYTGKVWINGTWTISGQNVKVTGGPVFVKNNIKTSGSGNLKIDGDLYYGGTKSGNITVTGKTVKYFPLGDFPVVNTDYYKAHYNIKLTTANEMATEDGTWESLSYVRITFNSDGTFTINNSTTIAIPSTGFIIYGENCNIRVTGTVHGRVTVVTSHTQSNKGVIKIRTGLAYANGTHNANEQDSFAALASNGIKFRGTSSSPFIVHGVFFDGTANDIVAANASGTATFYLYGTRNKRITFSGFSPYYTIFDPYLDQYPPNGLPEQPFIVSWRLK